MDITLHKGLLRGDPKSQRKLYDIHADRLMGVVQRYVRDVQFAENILQDSFVFIFQKINQFDAQKGSFNSWSHTIALNTTLMFLRKKHMSFTDISLLTEDYKILNTNSDNPQNEGMLAVIKTVLTENQFQVFQMKILEEMKHIEIAKELNIQPEVSRSTFKRAKEKLKKLFNISFQDSLTPQREQNIFVRQNEITSIHSENFLKNKL